MSMVHLTTASNQAVKLLYPVFDASQSSYVWSIISVQGLAFGGESRRKTHSHALIEHLQGIFKVLYGSPALFNPHNSGLRRYTCVQSDNARA